MIKIKYEEREKVNNIYNTIKNIILSKSDNQSFVYNHKQHHLYEETECPGISKNYYNENGSVEFKNIYDQTIRIEITRWHPHKHNGYSGLNGIPGLKAAIYIIKSGRQQLIWELNVESGTLSYDAKVSSPSIPNNILKTTNSENLKNNENLILELNKQIEELDEIKKLEKLKKEILELTEKIKKLSMYKLTEIKDIFVKLMTEFEGVEYECTDNFLETNFKWISPKKRNENYTYPNYKLEYIKERKEPYTFLEKEEEKLCFLPPSIYNEKNTSHEKSINKYNLTYIEDFINYLHVVRRIKLLYEINKEQLEEILQEFLENTKKEQQQRKEENNKNIEKALEYRKRKEYEKNCLIDRKLIYNVLTYIINNYEENITATQKKKKEYSGSNSWVNLYGYHKLIIKTNDKEVVFSTEVDCQGCYPDEVYCGFYVNMNKDTSIRFFDLKQELLPILKNTLYLEKFINYITALYEEKTIITSNDIEPILISLSNNKKERKRKLKI